jgi:NAD(P)-dependent dehydrogenase (short-subunit alcohol dehydrogenase family)
MRPWMPRHLQGRIALVAGATRGAGRGIAIALGEQGAKVYCTGRSTRGATTGRPETIEETAELVARAGGEGIAVRCDHARESEVRALAERVGRVDVLVNDIWGGDDATEWGKPFWELDLTRGLPMVRNAIETHLLTSRHFVPRMVAARRGLVVEITDGNAGWYRGNLLYDLVKSSVARIAFGMSEELRPHGVAAVAVTPGFLRSEAMLDRFGVTEATWRDGIAKDPHFAESETPRFVGRAVAALAADPAVMEKSGRVLASWDLAEEYGFDDADGRRPHWGRYFARAFPGVGKPLDDAYYAYLRGFDVVRDAGVLEAVEERNA